MNRSWILLALLAVLLIAIFWRNEISNLGDPSWRRCTESLFIQTVTGKCTLRYRGETQPT